VQDARAAKADCLVAGAGSIEGMGLLRHGPIDVVLVRV
jgi:hypothetical protein